MRALKLGAVALTAMVGATVLMVVSGGGPDPVPEPTTAHCPPQPGETHAPGSNVPTPATAAPPAVQALHGGGALAAPATPNPPGTATGEPTATATMPYELPATHGMTGAEEPVDDAGRVPSTGGKVTWSQHTALGAAYRDYYITMLWTYAAWDFNGRARDVDQDQYTWFAEQPRLVLVTNPRNNKSIIAAAIEAGPGPWVSFGGDRNGAAHGWDGFERGVPDGFDGIVSGFPPVALAALGARTGYAANTEPGDDLIYQWAPDQNAVPGPTTLTASPDTGAGVQVVANTGGPAAGEPCPPPAGVSGTAVSTGPVKHGAASVTVPKHDMSVYQGTDYGGTVIRTPNKQVSTAIAAGMQYLGTPYVWGGGGPAGPDNGCGRADCLPDVGFDCSGLTSYMLAVAGITIPTYSGAQRDQSKAVPWDQALPGDLVGYPGHISMYLGTINGQRMQIEAPSTGDFVKISTVHRSDVDGVVYRWWGTANA